VNYALTAALCTAHSTMLCGRAQGAFGNSPVSLERSDGNQAKARQESPAEAGFKSKG
jgi:hypothetical protein